MAPAAELATLLLRGMMRRQLARLRHEQIIVFGEIHHEIESHGLDVTQAGVENHRLHITEQRRTDIDGILQPGIWTALARAEPGHHAAKPFRPVARPKSLAVRRNALNEVFGWNCFGHVGIPV